MIQVIELKKTTKSLTKHTPLCLLCSTMALELPNDLIQQAKISTRTEAGLPDYNPDDPSLPAMPSLSASVAAFDPSPPYLRCKHCQGKLLRGLQSLICIYCGQNCIKTLTWLLTLFPLSPLLVINGFSKPFALMDGYVVAVVLFSETHVVYCNMLVCWLLPVMKE